MPSCEGRGECIQQCSHRGHNGYCKSECPHNCKLIECHNYRLCGAKHPQRFLDCHNGMCLNCAIMFGRIKFLDKKDECPICLINKDMIEVNCKKHRFCLDCWKNWSETSKETPLRCPLCRNPIWK